jgi:hypothetical protein
MRTNAQRVCAYQRVAMTSPADGPQIVERLATATGIATVLDEIVPRAFEVMDPFPSPALRTKSSERQPCVGHAVTGAA